MKKLILILLAALPFWSCESSNIKPIEFSSLPSKAQSFVKQHFADKTITMVFCDDELFDTDYEVRFDDGSSVEFDDKGEWTSVEVKTAGGVPEAVIPQNIRTFVASSHPTCYIVDINKDRREYEVELNNGVDIVFDKNGNFKRYEN